MIYLYALIEDPAPGLTTAVQAIPGLQGPLLLHSIGPWLLIWSDHDNAEILPKRRHLLAHTRVLKGILPFGTLLPARFGLVAEDMGAVERMILAKSTVLAAELARMRGCVELGIRIRFPRQAALEATLAEDAALARDRDRLARLGPEAHFALAEFGGRLADRLDRRRGAAQQALCRALVSHCRAHVLRKPEDDTEVLRAEFLLPADRQLAFLAAVEAAAASLGFAPGAEAEIRVVGPVPVYNFVRLSLAPDASEEAA